MNSITTSHLLYPNPILSWIDSLTEVSF